MGARRPRKNDARNPDKRAGAAQRAPARRPWFLLMVAAAAVVAAVVVFVNSREADPNRPQASPAGAAETTPPTTAPVANEGGARVAAPTPQRLLGKWQRTDGDYALDVRRIGAEGRAEVAYFNPGVINVSRAEVKQDGSRLVLSVELRDVNYPGSTYLLAYQPGQDVLVGTYLQPALGQTYEVGFVRAE